MDKSGVSRGGIREAVEDRMTRWRVRGLVAGPALPQGGLELATVVPRQEDHGPRKPAALEHGRPTAGGPKSWCCSVRIGADRLDLRDLRRFESLGTGLIDRKMLVWPTIRAASGKKG